MADDKRIAHGWKMPSGYRRTFVFNVHGAGFSEVMTIDTTTIRMRSRGSPRAGVLAQCMNWEQETIERVRREVGA